MRSSRVTSDKV